MMKKFLLMAVAAAAVSTPAMADTYKGKTYGQDAVAWYDIKAKVDSFCKFGTQNTDGGAANGAAVPGAPGSAAEGDGTFNLFIQDPNDNTVRQAHARINLAYAVCNSPFNMTLNSQNGGLKNNAITSDEEFTSLVRYGVDFNFDGINTTTLQVAQGTQTVATSTEARAGAAQVTVGVTASDDLLIQGAYTDRLTASLVPNLGA